MAAYVPRSEPGDAEGRRRAHRDGQRAGARRARRVRAAAGPRADAHRAQAGRADHRHKARARYAVSTGYLRVDPQGAVEILVEQAVPAKDIDPDAAKTSSRRPRPSSRSGATRRTDGDYADLRQRAGWAHARIDAALALERVLSWVRSRAAPGRRGESRRTAHEFRRGETLRGAAAWHPIAFGGISPDPEGAARASRRSSA